MVSNKQYKCPKCKHQMPVNRADFIKGVAMVSCGKCGTDSFTIEDFERDTYLNKIS